MLTWVLSVLDETAHIKSEEKKLHGELVQLTAILAKVQSSCVKLQEEYSAVMKDKTETDTKLHQLSLFVQKTLATSTPTAQPGSSPSPEPTLSPAASANRSFATTASSSFRSSSASSASDSPPRSPPSPTRRLLSFLRSPRSRSPSSSSPPLGN